MLRAILMLRALEAKMEGEPGVATINRLFERPNRKARRVVARELRDRYADYAADGGELTFWEWLWENREDIMQFLVAIITLLAAL
jgi:hypothetical protein